MNLALLTSSAPFGPGEEFVLVEAGALAGAGIDVFIIPVLQRQHAMRRSETPTTVTVLGHRGVVSPEVLGGFIAEAASHPIHVLKALALVSTWRPIQLMKNLIVLPKGLWLARLCKRYAFDHIHASWASTPATVAMIAGELARIPWSFTGHRGDIVDNNLLCRKLRHASFARFISRRSMQLAARCCPVHNGQRRLLHLGVHIPVKPSSKEASTGKPFIICCPANMVPVKGHRFLIDAMATFEQRDGVELWLAGDGPLREDLKCQAIRLGLNHTVRFLGQLRHQELLALYAELRVQLVVLPSLDMGNGIHEGIPVSLMEAMSYGIPVISTSSGGIPELLNDGAGLLVQPANVGELTTALRLMRDDACLRAQFGEAGRRRVSRHFNLTE